MTERKVPSFRLLTTASILTGVIAIGAATHMADAASGNVASIVSLIGTGGLIGWVSYGWWQRRRHA